jgi:hypothetical protein
VGNHKPLPQGLQALLYLIESKQAFSRPELAGQDLYKEMPLGAALSGRPASI